MAQAAADTVTTVGDRVLLTDKKKGEVQFVGELAGKKGVFYGIKLDDASGDSNGTINKVVYFEAEEKHAIFVPKSKIKKSKPGPESDAPRVTVGTRVKIASKGEGEVAFIGQTAFKPGSVWYGIKLDEANGKNNGTVGKRKYFSCKDKHGAFVQASKVEVAAAKPKASHTKSKSKAKVATDSKSKDKKEKKEKDSKKKDSKKKKDDKKENTKKKDGKVKKTDGNKKDGKKKEVKKKEEVKYSVGDKVMVKPNKKGQIRWIGEEKAFGISEWYGVRLTEKRGDCDGEYKNIRHFHCPEGFGVYVQKKLLDRKLEEKEIDFDFSNEEEKYEAEKNASVSAAKAKKEKKRMIRDFFKSADKDGDFDIDRNEWKRLCNSLWPSMAPEEVETLFKSIDVSNSGEISIAEFESYSGLDDLLDRMQSAQKEKEKEKEKENDENDETGDNKDKENDDVAAGGGGDDGAVVSNEDQKEEQNDGNDDAGNDDGAANDDAGNDNNEENNDDANKDDNGDDNNGDDNGDNNEDAANDDNNDNNDDAAAGGGDDDANNDENDNNDDNEA